MKTIGTLDIWTCRGRYVENWHLPACMSESEAARWFQDVVFKLRLQFANRTALVRVGRFAFVLQVEGTPERAEVDGWHDGRE